ncbi:MAG: formate/nitrite transporter family protein [Actinomycetota bacterium]|nr:formate/nitrite transporter family protein [Actinomycetota bacterium]
MTTTRRDPDLENQTGEQSPDEGRDSHGERKHEIESTRPTAGLVYERVKTDAAEELERPNTALAFSALFAGFTMGASYLGLALGATALMGPGGKLVATLLYPIGYIAVIIGRAQLFTENTLYPIVPSLEDRTVIPKTAQLWATALAGNLVGGVFFALVVTKTSALPSEVTQAFTGLGETAASRGFTTTFWSAVLAGWLLALVAWVVAASEEVIGQFFVIFLLTLPVGLASLDHSVATAIAVMAALVEGQVGPAEALGWEATAVLGNALGGVLIVAVINYGQVRSQR